MSAPPTLTPKQRFTDAQTGIGGRLDFKKLEGTHVTPNQPSLTRYLDGLDLEVGGPFGVADAVQALREAVERAECEQRQACACIAEFAEREVRRIS